MLELPVRPTCAPFRAAAESGGVRPFGVSLLMAGYDDNGPQLYQIDPSGSYFAWKASAIGKNMVNAKTFLEKRYRQALGRGLHAYTRARAVCQRARSLRRVPPQRGHGAGGRDPHGAAHAEGGL